MDVKDSIEQIIAAYTPTVYGVALTHTARRADADDVFQEVFAAYWRATPKFNSEEHRKAWLIRTTINFCLKLTQSSWAKKTVYADGEDGPTPTGIQPDRSNGREPAAGFSFPTQQQRALYAAISGLSASYRTVVMLFYFEDLPIARIAELLGEQQGTIKTRLTRARAQLRRRLKEGHSDD